MANEANCSVADLELTFAEGGHVFVRSVLRFIHMLH